MKKLILEIGEQRKEIRRYRRKKRKHRKKESHRSKQRREKK